LRQEQRTPVLQRRQRLTETFARIPHARAVELARHRVSGPAWFILVELDRLVLKARGRNPIRLINRNLRTAGIHRNTKTRALQQLEAAGAIRIMETRPGRPPLVAHLWYPLQG
jgi:hypothetical protein